MKIKDARKSHEAIQTLMTKKLPIKMAFAIQKNAKQIAEIIEFADKRQNEIIEKSAQRDEKGEYVQSEDGKGIRIADVQTFANEMEELAETDMPVEFVKITMPDVERCDEDRFDSLSPAELDAIECMIEE